MILAACAPEMEAPRAGAGLLGRETGLGGVRVAPRPHGQCLTVSKVPPFMLANLAILAAMRRALSTVSRLLTALPVRVVIEVDVTERLPVRIADEKHSASSSIDQGGGKRRALIGYPFAVVGGRSATVGVLPLRGLVWGMRKGPRPGLPSGNKRRQTPDLRPNDLGVETLGLPARPPSAVACLS